MLKEYPTSSKYVWSRYAYAQDLDSAVFSGLITPKSKKKTLKASRSLASPTGIEPMLSG